MGACLMLSGAACTEYNYNYSLVEDGEPRAQPPASGTIDGGDSTDSPSTLPVLDGNYVTEFDLSTNLVYAGANETLVVGTSAESPSLPDSVVFLEPATGRVLQSIALERGAASRLALSGDGTTLWAVSTISGDLVSVDLTSDALTPTVVGESLFPTIEDAPVEVTGLEAVTGRSDAVIVSTTAGGRFFGATLYVSGEAQPLALAGSAGPSQLVSVGSAEWLYGAGAGTFYALPILEGGLAANPYPELIPDGSVAPSLFFGAERVYSSDGSIIDVSVPGSPVGLSALPAASDVLLPLDGRLVTATGLDGSDQLQSYDATTLEPIAGYTIAVDVTRFTDVVATTPGYFAVGAQDATGHRLHLFANPF
ncbi:MAG: hypothetical protein AAGA56_29135 [Myxococcota bacterium]